MLYKDAFRGYNSYLSVEDILKEIIELEQEAQIKRTKIQLKLIAEWMTLDQLESMTGLTARSIRSKIREASLVGIMVDKQWWLLKESVEDAGYAD